MTVLGLGSDVVVLRGFAEQLGIPGSTFLECFTPAERVHARDGAREVETLAGRWAAKEAFVKAWSSTRRGRPPRLGTIDLREIEVVADAFGRPWVRLHGAVRTCVADELGDPDIHVSISHDATPGDPRDQDAWGVAMATVVISR